MNLLVCVKHIKNKIKAGGGDRFSILWEMLDRVERAKRGKVKTLNCSKYLIHGSLAFPLCHYINKVIRITYATKVLHHFIYPFLVVLSSG